MTLDDMLTTINCGETETIEIRDASGYEVGTFPIYGNGLIQYKNCKVLRWFPGGAPGKKCTVTITLETD